METLFYLWVMNETQTHTMNKVTTLPRRYDWEYTYSVDGVIFVVQQNEYTKKSWSLAGYESQEKMDNGEPFLVKSAPLKRRHTDFLKCTFKRQDWGL